MRQLPKRFTTTRNRNEQVILKQRPQSNWWKADEIQQDLNRREFKHQQNVSEVLGRDVY